MFFLMFFDVFVLNFRLSFLSFLSLTNTTNSGNRVVSCDGTHSKGITENFGQLSFAFDFSSLC